MHTFALFNVTTPANPEPVPNDPIIRKLAILSQLAIFKDIIPGYRIRALTEAEQAEKVSQMVARTRDWEQGLVVVYQAYLRLLEKELKSTLSIIDKDVDTNYITRPVRAHRRRAALHVHHSFRAHSFQLPGQCDDDGRITSKQEVMGRGIFFLSISPKD